MAIMMRLRWPLQCRMKTTTSLCSHRRLLLEVNLYLKFQSLVCLCTFVSPNSIYLHKIVARSETSPESLLFVLFRVRFVEPKSIRYVLFCCVFYLAFYKTDVKENTVVAKVQVIDLSGAFRNFDYTSSELCLHSLDPMWKMGTWHT